MQYNRLLADILPLLTLAAIAAAATIILAGPASAAVRWEVNGEKGEACANASAAWALFKAAQSPEGITSAKVSFPPAEDPFVKRCLAERAQKAASRKASAE